MNWLYFKSEKSKFLSLWDPDAWGENALVDNQMIRSSMERQMCTCNECLVYTALWDRNYAGKGKNKNLLVAVWHGVNNREKNILSNT